MDMRGTDYTLGVLYELDTLMENEKEKLETYCSGKKKYEDVLGELLSWYPDEKNEFVDDTEKIIKGKKLGVDNDFRLAVYMARYGSYFHTIGTLGLKKEEEIALQLETLTSIPREVESYIEAMREMS